MSKRIQVSEAPGAADLLRPVIISVVIGVVTCALVLVLMSVALSTQNIPQRAIGPMAAFAITAGAFAAGFSCAKAKRRGGLSFGAISGAAFCLVTMLASLTISDSGFGVPALFKILFIMLAAMLGGVFGVNARQRRKRV